MKEHQITDRGDLERAVAGDRFLLFKHSPICPYSARAFTEYAAFAAAHPDVPHGWIDVIAQRSWSHWVAETVEIPHESPQALLVLAGRVAWHASHHAITRDALDAAVHA